MFGNGRRKADEALMRIELHEKDCAEERRRTEASRLAMGLKIDTHHAENRQSIRGIYSLLWAILCSIVFGLFAIIAWFASNFIVWKAPT